jgi:hypothetical protein
MSLAEILHRVEEQLFLVYLRFAFKFKKKSFFNAYSVSEFSFCASDLKKLPKLDWDFEPTSLQVRQWLAGSWPALNYSWRWVKDSNCWNIAPDKSGEWPTSFFNSISYREGNSNGDVRIAWEPSRLQQLVALSLVSQDHQFNVSKAAVNLIEDQLRDWLESNQFLAGIHYISSMECALRIISVCYALDISRNHIKPNSSAWNNLLNLVESHASLIEKRLSLYSSSGNHTISEAVGLLYAGINFPELKRADIWKRKALILLRAESDRQILSDGGSVEQSFWYLLFVSDLYGLADMLLDHIGCRDQKIQAAHVRASEFISTFASRPDQIPDIGDRDDGYALSKFLRISFKNNEKNIVTKTFEQSGYTQCRCTGDIELIIDHGQLGMSPSFGHGHADCLSLLMSHGDKEVITDCGTSGYAINPEWRKYFRGSSAHNTVTIDGLDQAEYVNSFMWKNAYEAKLLFREESEKGLYLLASHNGYGSIGVTHWRGIFVDYQYGCFVWDRLDGVGNHSLNLRWHLGEIPYKNGDKFLIDAENSIELSIINADEIKTARGQLNPISGWKSSGYGEKLPISTLEAKYSGKLPHEFNTHISWSGDSMIKSDAVKLAAEKFRGIASGT